MRLGDNNGLNANCIYNEAGEIVASVYDIPMHRSIDEVKAMGEHRKDALQLGRTMAAAEDLLQAVKDGVAEMVEFLEATGPCDHSVGICYCDLADKIERARALIKDIEQ